VSDPYGESRLPVPVRPRGCPGGSYVASRQLENRLKGHPLVSQVLVHGDCRPSATALVTLNPDEPGRFTQEAGVVVGTPGPVAADPAVTGRLQRIVDGVNARLLSHAGVKRFAGLPADFTLEAGELSPTRKLRRLVITERYRTTLDRLCEPAGVS
jgi:long-chain acyl-CoA synthetase